MRDDDLFGIAIDYDVPVVRGQNDLPEFLGLTNRADKFVHDELVVEMVVVGIDNDRVRALRKINLDKNCRLLAKRQTTERGLLVLNRWSD